MYFESRTQAGQVLAAQLLEAYRYENCAVIALNDGAVLIGEQVAGALHCVLTMLVTEDVDLPGESLSLGAVSQAGNFTYNTSFSQGEIDGYVSEFHGYLEEQKREAFQNINRLIGEGGVIDRELLRDRVIILVSDGLDDSASLDVALGFIKPIRYQKLVVATPVATVAAVDKMHIAADEIHILDVKTNYMGVNHYYEDNNTPTREQAIERINKIILNWQ